MTKKDAILRHFNRFFVQFSPFSPSIFLIFPLHLHYFFQAVNIMVIKRPCRGVKRQMNIFLGEIYASVVRYRLTYSWTPCIAPPPPASSGAPPWGSSPPTLHFYTNGCLFICVYTLRGHTGGHVRRIRLLFCKFNKVYRTKSSLRIQTGNECNIWSR